MHIYPEIKITIPDNGRTLVNSFIGRTILVAMAKEILNNKNMVRMIF